MQQKHWEKDTNKIIDMTTNFFPIPLFEKLNDIDIIQLIFYEISLRTSLQDIDISFGIYCFASLILRSHVK